MVEHVETETQALRIPEHLWVEVAAQIDLTERELAIVRGLFAGEGEQALARRLGISGHTVHTHLGRLYRKLGVHSCHGLLLKVFAILFDRAGKGQ